MTGFGRENHSKKEYKPTNQKKVSIDQLTQKAFTLQAQGRKLEAAQYYAHLIKQGIKDYRVFSNYGIFLNEIGKNIEAEFNLKKAISLNPNYANAYYNLAVLFIDKGKLDKAEFNLKKAIKLKPDFAIANYNLGFILKDLGRLKEAEFNLKKALEIEPQFTDPYFSLSTMDAMDKNEKWQNQLFSESILKNKNNRELVNIFFARSNILHKEKK